MAFTILLRVGVVACLLLRGLEEPREEEDFIEQTSCCAFYALKGRCDAGDNVVELLAGSYWGRATRPRRVGGVWALDDGEERDAWYCSQASRGDGLGGVDGCGVGDVGVGEESERRQSQAYTMVEAPKRTQRSIDGVKGARMQPATKKMRRRKKREEMV